MNLSQLEVLIAIVETGSLTEAAEVVSLTQSAVSYSLSKLEAELGVTLLERGRQGIALTQIGEEVLPHARQILSQTELIRQKSAQARGLSVGKLRFGCVPTVPGRILTTILREFNQKYPDIEIVLFEGVPTELVEWLDTGVIDVATVLSAQKYPASILLVRDEIQVIASAHHPLASQSDVQFEQLLSEPLIGPKADYGILSELLGLPWKPFPRLRHEVSTQSTIFAMVRENMGVSIMPQMLHERALDDIVRLSFSPKRYIEVYLATNVESPATQAFLETAHDIAQERGLLSSII